MNCSLLKSVGAVFFASAIIVAGCKKDNDSDATQEVPTNSLSVNIKNITSPTGAIQQTLNITSNVKWTASVSEASSGWLSIDHSTGENNGSIKVSIKANESNDPRAGNIVLKAVGISDVNIPVEQKGLIDFARTVPNGYNLRLVEKEDGYVSGGTRNGRIYISKANKTTGELIKDLTIQVPQYSTGQLTDMESTTGGLIITGYLVTANTGEMDIYVAQLNDNLEIIKEKVLDFGNDPAMSSTIHPMQGGFVLCGYNRGGAFLTQLNTNLEEQSGTRQSVNIFEHGDLRTTPAGEFLLCGSIDGKFGALKFNNTLVLRAIFTGTGTGRLGSIYATAENRIIAAGTMSTASGTDIYCVELDSRLDAIPGREKTIDKSQYDYGFSIIGLNGGGFAVSGAATFNNQQQGYSTRLDNNFDLINGKEVILPFAYMSSIQASHSHPDGGYLLTGISRDVTGPSSKIVRINP